MAFIRKVKTKSGATAVQIAYSSYGKIVKIEHIGSAHNSSELEVLIELATQKLKDRQPSLFEPPTDLDIIKRYLQLLSLYYGSFSIIIRISPRTRL